MRPRNGAFLPSRPKSVSELPGLGFDRDGYLWIPRARRGDLPALTRQTDKFDTWRVQPNCDNDHTVTGFVAPAPEGTVWCADEENRIMFVLDTKTGHITVYQCFPGYTPERTADILVDGVTPEGHRTDGIGADSKSNGYSCDILNGDIGRIGATTGTVTLFKTPL
jgi:streptogramin lyase